MSITEPVVCHHDPLTMGKYPLEAALFRLADIICHTQVLEFTGACFVVPLEQAVWERLKIPAGLLAAIVK